MQVLAGDVLAAQQSYWHYFGLWQIFGALPERFLYPQGHLHPNQQQYPLRPELLESTFYLYQVSLYWPACPTALVIPTWDGRQQQAMLGLCIEIVVSFSSSRKGRVRRHAKHAAGIQRWKPIR